MRIQTSIKEASTSSHTEIDLEILPDNEDSGIFIDAILEGRLDEVKKLIQKKFAGVNDTHNNLGFTPLHIAVSCGHVDIVKYLVLEAKADVNRIANNGATPIFCALIQNRIDIMRFLVFQGKANVHIRNNNKKGLLHIAAEMNKDAVSFLVDEVKAKTKIQDEKGYTPLHYATRFGDPEILHLLLKNKGCINMKDYKGGFSPLHTAVTNSRLKAVQMLVEAGANVDIQDNSGATPLHIAIVLREKEIANYLMTQAKANPNILDKDWLKPNEYAKYSAFISTALDRMGDPKISADPKLTECTEAIMRTEHFLKAGRKKEAIEESLKFAALFRKLPDSEQKRSLYEEYLQLQITCTETIIEDIKKEIESTTSNSVDDRDIDSDIDLDLEKQDQKFESLPNITSLPKTDKKDQKDSDLTKKTNKKKKKKNKKKNKNKKKDLLLVKDPVDDMKSTQELVVKTESDTRAKSDSKTEPAHEERETLISLDEEVTESSVEIVKPIIDQLIAKAMSQISEDKKAEVRLSKISPIRTIVINQALFHRKTNAQIRPDTRIAAAPKTESKSTDPLTSASLKIKHYNTIIEKMDSSNFESQFTLILAGIKNGDLLNLPHDVYEYLFQKLQPKLIENSVIGEVLLGRTPDLCQGVHARQETIACVYLGILSVNTHKITLSSQTVTQTQQSESVTIPSTQSIGTHSTHSMSTDVTDETYSTHFTGTYITDGSAPPAQFSYSTPTHGIDPTYYQSMRSYEMGPNIYPAGGTTSQAYIPTTSSAPTFNPYYQNGYYPHDTVSQPSSFVAQAHTMTPTSTPIQITYDTQMAESYWDASSTYTYPQTYHYPNPSTHSGPPIGMALPQQSSHHHHYQATPHELGVQRSTQYTNAFRNPHMLTPRLAMRPEQLQSSTDSRSVAAASSSSTTMGAIVTTSTPTR